MQRPVSGERRIMIFINNIPCYRRVALAACELFPSGY
jgi:hypothetical protein